jgi:chromosome partitioning protein
MTNPIIVLAALKGGVGKSTLAACIGAELHQQGKKVVLIDADPQQSMAYWIGNESGPIGDIQVVVDPTSKAATRAQELSKKSIVVIDTPGFAARELIDLMRVASHVVIPCRPSGIDARRALEALEMVDLVNQERRKKAAAMVVLNHVTPRSTLASYIRDELVAAGARVLKAEIAHRAVFSEAELFHNAPALMGKRASKAAAEVTAVTNEIIST